MSQRRLLGFLVISTFTVLVYYPSIWHAPRSDQIVYFFVTAGRHDWYSLAISCFDLNRWGTFSPGDDRLFRPLVYFFLGTEKYLFGYRFWLWQATGIILHLTAVWFLLKLLWRLTTAPVAFACALFFSLFLMNMEMVIWSHIHSYLVFVILLLIILDQVYVLINTESEVQFKRMALISLCFLIAGFIYETANIFAVCTAIFLMKKRYSWALLIPPVLYFILDTMNLRYHHIVLDMNSLNLMAGSKNVMASWGFWIYSALWPGLTHIYFDARNKISEGSFNLLTCYASITAAMIIMAAGCRKLEPVKKKFIFLIMAMMFFYSLVIGAGRVRSHGISWVLTQNMHYYYPFWALMMIVAGVLIGAAQDRRSRTVLVAILVFLSLLNGMKLYQINELQAERSRATLLLARSVELLIAEKGNTRDFSFYVPPDYKGNYAYSDIYGRKSSFIGMLFPKYYKENMPKYVFSPVS